MNGSLKWLSPGLLVLVAGLGQARAWSPLRAPDGSAVSWPAESWPLPLAEAGGVWAAAAAAWSTAGPVGFRPVHDVTPPGPDGVVTLAEIAEAEAWRAVVGDPALVGFTLLAHQGDRLEDADVYLNRARFPLDGGRGSYRRDAVLAHELGHVLGLGHPCGDRGTPACSGLPEGAPERDAALFPLLSPGDAPRAPGADDRAGLRAVAAAPGAPRVPRLGRVERVGAGWRAEVRGLEPGDLVRVRGAGGELVTAGTTVEPGAVVLGAATDAAARDLEVWTTAGQGLYAPGVLAPTDSPDAGPEADAGQGADAAGHGGTPRGAGCALVPGSHPPGARFLLLTLLGIRIVGRSRLRRSRR